MSNKTVTIDQMADAIMEGLEEYRDLASEEVKKAVKKSAKLVRDEIKAGAPVKTGRYAKSWSTKTTKETTESLEITVYSPRRYMLAHLLENGHAKRGGGRVRAIPHIKPAEQAGIGQLENDITRSLGGV